MRTEPAVTLHTVCGLEELAGHGARGVSHVLSLLDPGTPEPEAFTAYGAHARTTLRFHDCLAPGEGLTPPSPSMSGRSSISGGTSTAPAISWFIAITACRAPPRRC